LVQGLLFIEVGVARGRHAFGMPKGWTGWLAWALLEYASIGYPMLGQLWATASILTFGLFLLTTEPISRRPLVILVLWSLIGGSAAFLLGMTQDWLLFVSRFTVIAMLKRNLRRDLRPKI
jgi:hypothetical protein